MSEIGIVNEGKKQTVEAGGKPYNCLAVKTRLITLEDTIENVVDEYIKPIIEPGDVLFISEKMLACTQGRAIHLDDIHPGYWANLLSRHATRAPDGSGLATPKTMQCAIKECGLPRILLAAFVGAIGKLFRQKGWFYRVTGYQVASIDGPSPWTIPPYNNYVVLGPKNTKQTTQILSEQLDGNAVLIIDVNDYGGKILAASPDSVDCEKMLALLSQNPLGQTNESTPMGLLRPVG